MIVSRSQWKTATIGLAVLVAIAVAGPKIRHRTRSGCALDGMPIDPLLQVRVVDAEEETHAFCCIRCAQLWLEHQGRPPVAIYVADEETGDEVEAGQAFFVRSRVITMAATENRIHAFAHRSDAEKHAQLYGGSVLPKGERPF
jgi:hypothetical protein